MRRLTIAQEKQLKSKVNRVNIYVLLALFAIFFPAYLSLCHILNLSLNAGNIRDFFFCFIPITIVPMMIINKIYLTKKGIKFVAPARYHAEMIEKSRREHYYAHHSMNTCHPVAASFYAAKVGRFSEID